jgi:hypothetical protein
LPLPSSGATRKLVINASIYNRVTDARINVQLHDDVGCEAFDLVLLLEDVGALDIAPTGDSAQDVQSDGSVISLNEYSRVRVELEHLDGTTEVASLEPYVQARFTESEATAIGHVVPAEAPFQRLLGYGGLTRFGLKQDFVGHKLVYYMKRA